MTTTLPASTDRSSIRDLNPDIEKGIRNYFGGMDAVLRFGQHMRDKNLSADTVNKLWQSVNGNLQAVWDQVCGKPAVQPATFAPSLGGRA